MGLGFGAGLAVKWAGLGAGRLGAVEGAAGARVGFELD